MDNDFDIFGEIVSEDELPDDAEIISAEEARNLIGGLLREAYEADPSLAPELEQIAKMATVLTDFDSFCTGETYRTKNYEYIVTTAPDLTSADYVTIVQIETIDEETASKPTCIFQGPSRLAAVKAQHAFIERFIEDPSYEPTEFYDIQSKETNSIFDAHDN